MSDDHNEKLKAARIQAEQFAKRKLNTHSPDLQVRLLNWVEAFLEQKTHFIPGTTERVDFPRYGMLAELLARTPCRIYDLPELKAHCDTAFVDTTGRLYISDSFFNLIEKEQKENKNSIFFIFAHEMEHNRRMHLQRMLEYPSDIANIAQDIRINCDTIQLLAWDHFTDNNDRTPNDDELLESIKEIYQNLGPAIQSGWATSDYSEYLKWQGKSEEAIAAEIYKNQEKTKKTKENTEISFPMLCEGVAQDLDAMSSIATKNSAHQNATDYIQVAISCRDAGKSKGKVSVKDLENLLQNLDIAINSIEITERNLQHDLIAKAAALSNKPVQSVISGDAYVDSLVPLERLSALKQVIQLILNPSNSNSSNAANQQNGKIQIKDLDLPRSNPKSQKSSEKNGDQPGSSPSIYNGDEHVMTAEKLADILKKAGVHDAVKALGYDDLEKIANEEDAAKNNVSTAINKATSDSIKLGSVYAGAHLIDYASEMMQNFYKPVLSWKLQTKLILEELGKKTRFEHDEPWIQYFTSAEDQGLDSEDDVGYMGSHVSGSTVRPLAIYIIDTSGSVTNNMLKRFISEAVNAARDLGTSDLAPEVIIVFADTIARGQPILVNEENMGEYLKSGVNFGGRGGTNFTASVQNVFRMLTIDCAEDSELTPFKGRKIDAMIYFTDTFDAPPDQVTIEDTAYECGMNKLPTMLFLAPKECYSESFKNGVSSYAECIFFDKTELELDFEEIENSIQDKGRRNILN